MNIGENKSKEVYYCYIHKQIHTFENIHIDDDEDGWLCEYLYKEIPEIDEPEYSKPYLSDISECTSNTGDDSDEYY